MAYERSDEILTVTTDATNAGAGATVATTQSALRTPAYLVLSLIGAGIAAAAFLPWAGVSRTDGAVFEFASQVVGIDAGGWGLAAIIAGAAIVLLGLIGYFVNPFSDPEALFITGFGAAITAAALFKMFSPNSLIDPDGLYPDADAAIGPGLWLIVVGGALCVAGGLAIAGSRRDADKRLS